MESLFTFYVLLRDGEQLKIITVISVVNSQNQKKYYVL